MIMFVMFVFVVIMDGFSGNLSMVVPIVMPMIVIVVTTAATVIIMVAIILRAMIMRIVMRFEHSGFLWLQ